ncbi:hypothetical protein FQA39_LY00147 [Lamprigera yunnana]|nr:hypothetical protein FQA39_LY00147 [Lamprigera yunnana]
MADVVVDPQITDSKELEQLGIRAYVTRDYNSAVTAFSRAIELIVPEHGDKHDSLGEIYLLYGKTLLEISREEAEALGDAVTRDFSSDSDAEEDNNENAQKEKTTAGKVDETREETKNISGNEEKPKAEGSSECQNCNVETKPEESKNSKQTEADGDSTEEKSEGEPTDLQLAWEILELAKIIFEKRGVSGREGLSETLVMLGDVSLESENFENAVADIKAGLEIQKEIFQSDNRSLAETYYKLGIAFSTNNQIDEAIGSYNSSLDVLNKRLVRLKQNEVNERDEIKDIESLIPDITEKITDMKSYKDEAVSKLVATMASKPVTEKKFETGSSSSSDKRISDISHLVKRKRAVDDSKEATEDASVKKISL